ncbi:MAG: phenylalanine--tRNA ligase subunit beta, partial [Candidatus Eisenbacteria bacterium]
LAQHPKGRGYAHLLAGLSHYPILKDRRGRVLSMPPIINSDATRVTLTTRKFFIDVTGLSERAVSRTLSIIVTSLLENLPGATARAVEIVGPGPGERRVTPDVTAQKMDLDPASAAGTLGIALDAEQCAALLGRMRHDTEILADGKVRASIPIYRNDILHEIDLVEDVGIAYGYHNIVPTLLPTFTVGGEAPIQASAERARAVLCGLGFCEVLTLLLTNPEEHDRLLGRPDSTDAVRIENPASSEQSMLRTSLLPGLLDAFRRNLTQPLPQRIFEVGEVTRLDARAETGAGDRHSLGCGIVSPRAGFEEAKAIAEALLREFGRRVELRACSEAPFLPGRAAEAWTSAPSLCLRFGEIHPEVLERFGIQNPTIVLEGDLGVLAGIPED